MEKVCPIVNTLFACFNCTSQTLPPLKLCENAHLACPPCYKYLPHCTCGQQFMKETHCVVDSFAFALKMSCKYRESYGSGDEGRQSPENDECQTRWFSVQDITEHYRSQCTMNVFACPIRGCSHCDRVDTIVEHYEGPAHGPIDKLEPDDPEWPYQISFRISS